MRAKPESLEMHGTTILAVRKKGEVVIIGDGQVTRGATIVKPNVRKIRRISGDKVIAGFAGSTADCFALLDRLETKLEENGGQLLRAAVDLAKAWRTDKFLRHLNATIIAVDKEISLQITGVGDVLSEPEDGIIAIGSGGTYALAAARALVEFPELSAEDVARRAMKIAADICIHTNHNTIIEKMVSEGKSKITEAQDHPLSQVEGDQEKPKTGSDSEKANHNSVDKNKS